MARQTRPRTTPSPCPYLPVSQPPPTTRASPGSPRACLRDRREACPGSGTAGEPAALLLGPGLLLLVDRGLPYSGLGLVLAVVAGLRVGVLRGAPVRLLRRLPPCVVTFAPQPVQTGRRTSRSSAFFAARSWDALRICALYSFWASPTSSRARASAASRRGLPIASRRGSCGRGRSGGTPRGPGRHGGQGRGSSLSAPGSSTTPAEGRPADRQSVRGHGCTG
ncbi:hypothetical protein ABID95_004180 [Streptomyces atratus]